jgi:hypothetical protein
MICELCGEAAMPIKFEGCALCESHYRTIKAAKDRLQEPGQNNFSVRGFINRSLERVNPSRTMHVERVPDVLLRKMAAYAAMDEMTLRQAIIKALCQYADFVPTIPSDEDISAGE